MDLDDSTGFTLIITEGDQDIPKKVSDATEYDSFGIETAKSYNYGSLDESDAVNKSAIVTEVEAMIQEAHRKLDELYGKDSSKGKLSKAFDSLALGLKNIRRVSNVPKVKK